MSGTAQASEKHILSCRRCFCPLDSVSGTCRTRERETRDTRELRSCSSQVWIEKTLASAHRFSASDCFPPSPPPDPRASSHGGRAGPRTEPRGTAGSGSLHLAKRKQGLWRRGCSATPRCRSTSCKLRDGLAAVPATSDVPAGAAAVPTWLQLPRAPSSVAIPRSLPNVCAMDGWAGSFSSDPTCTCSTSSACSSGPTSAATTTTAGAAEESGAETATAATTTPATAEGENGSDQSFLGERTV
ncbi:hypothetical protein BRADI_2g08174v3 [Brachypodium distachyon]|uniref:Uncharacterized protein n=1 Tax=Brachypodium distachyon TaxID=15368 RepID=A0A0Q3FVP4_BRADI|nr:hypothetical protein BRADI_2g08174v3 [Brachypodium distachyon]